MVGGRDDEGIVEELTVVEDGAEVVCSGTWRLKVSVLGKERGMGGWTFDWLRGKGVIFHSLDAGRQRFDVVDRRRQILQNQFSGVVREGVLQRFQIVASVAANIDQKYAIFAFQAPAEIVLDGVV